MKKILVVSVEPPPTSSGLGTLWAKLSLGMKDTPLTLDFMGPDPGVSSPYGLSGLDIPGTLHPFADPPLTRKISINRNQTHSVMRMYWSILRLPFYVREHFGNNGYLDWIIKKIEKELPALLSNDNFDAVAVHVPPLSISQAVRDCAKTASLPFIYIVGDPQGYRDTEGAFYPQNMVLEQNLINSAAAVVITRPTFDFFYSKTFDLDVEKVVFFSDCFLPWIRRQRSMCIAGEPFKGHAKVMLHYGNIDPWRSIDYFLDALATFNKAASVDGNKRIKFAVMGKIINNEQYRKARRVLNSAFLQIPICSYAESRIIAANSDFLMVAVSPRHLDNIPSKLIDGLAYRVPIMLLAKRESAASELVSELGVGVIVDPDDLNSVTAGLLDIIDKEEVLREKFNEAETLLAEWSCKKVAESFQVSLFSVMKW